ncbi:MAG: nitrate/sulfonate/bicarbonate ABC transporter ATP-binding protein [Vicinamibacteria bacterium]
MNDAPICELRGVQKSFDRGGGKPLRVLEDINLAIRPNEVVCLIGPSGCGKSTILRIFAGLIRPTRGEVLHHGEKLGGLNPGVAIVFQSFALFPWMTVEGNVETVLRATGLAEKEVRDRTRHAIQLVGLAGFERAYPRELSGGMKQRVGTARALSVDPELLFLDEPFSQVDALTAEGLRAEILDIWYDTERNPSSILMVSHDSREVVYMADRIVVLSANPGRVRTVLDNTLPRPRDARSNEFLRMVDKVHDIITSTELPDVTVTTAEASVGLDLLEPLPSAQSGDILGLLEFLEGQGGSSELFQVAAQTRVPFERVLNSVKGAEMLDLVDTPRRLVVFTPLGQRFVRADMDERKKIWRDQLLQLRLFRIVKDLMELRGGDVSKDEVVQEISTRLPMEDPEVTFGTIVAWGRFGELFDYHEDQGMITPA